MATSPSGSRRRAAAAAEPAAAGDLCGLDAQSLLDVLTAAQRGDFTARLVVDQGGAVGRVADALNAVMAQNELLAAELERVRDVVGRKGRLAERASLPGGTGGWRTTIGHVNDLIADLAQPVAEIERVIGAVARGDLTPRVEVEAEGRAVRGEFRHTATMVNAMVDQLASFASEVTRVAREVGTEGQLGGQAHVPGVSGTWKDLTDSVNSMADNLTVQVRNIAEVTTAVATGDLSKKITVEARGEIAELKATINTMVDQLSAFASEVTRVAREVGAEGKLGGQAEVAGVSGTWKDLTDNVNSMADNLTVQVRNIAEVTTAVATGDLSKKITVEAKGEIAELKTTINTMVEQLSAFASEVTRVAREVGTEGQLGGQAAVAGVSGTWKDLTDNVNSMADNLTVQVRNIAEVTTAVATGDLSKKITVEARGEILELKDTINTMVDQLSAFASEVTRVAREVGTEGKLGGQAAVEGVSGTWKDLTDNVNYMASDLTTQVRAIAEVTTAVATGDLGKKITVEAQGEILALKNTINTMVDQLSSFASEVTRVAREVGTEGQLGGQARVPGVSGTWKDLTDNVNSMADNLTTQVRNIAEVTTAVATGDLSKKITVEVQGELAELKATINTMVDQLSAFASEVTRVAREVGTEGQLGGQARVPGVSGTWKDLTDNVNSMADNLTTQVRGIAEVVTAVARGNLDRKLQVEARGEVAELRDTINAMIDTLDTFAEQVTSVAREVGVEGKLGAQAEVPGASGTWRDLTDNVNQLAANLTTQVRAITEVTTAVTAGDLSKQITVEAAGEVGSLRDNVNEMILSLKDTTRVNQEQDWLKTSLTRFTQLLQGQKELHTVTRLILSELAPLVGVQHGAFYWAEREGASDLELKLMASYAYRARRGLNNRFHLGEGLVGQCALEKERILITDVPHDYVQVNSGLGAAPPRNIVVLPVLFEGEVKAVIELASLHHFSDNHLTFLDQLTESVGIVLNSIEANMRTEALLAQSQDLTQELQSQQEELQQTNRRLEEQARTLGESEELLRQQREALQQTNVELEQKALQLAEQNQEVERKNSEIEQARRAVEEKVEQLALTSKYKSEFLANMSHELRTPLNSMLILSRMLAENNDGHLTTKQVEYAETIHSSGSDLLGLINEILDLSKIESGAMPVEIERVALGDVADDVERMFREVANGRGIDFEIVLADALPATFETDPRRLQQVLKNLLSNAFKFTHEGSVTLRVAPPEGVTFRTDGLRRAERVLGFAVEDTGIGIEPDKQRIIFEAFQQADGSVDRTYGGTGLGLSISREIARLLGGEIHLASQPGEGSTFTLYLPEEYTPSEGYANDETIHIEGAEPVAAPAEAVPALPAPAQAAPAPAAPALAAPVAAEPLGDGLSGASPSPAVDEPPDRPRALAALPEDDRAQIVPGDRVLLIVEDDAAFAGILIEVARERGFKAVVAAHAEAALAAVRRYTPSAITLDIHLPGMHGLALLDRLKNQPETRHIPVQIVSVADALPRHERRGVVSQLRKPVERADVEAGLARAEHLAGDERRRLLVVEDDETHRGAIASLLAGDDVEIVAVGTAAEAHEQLAGAPFDCAVVDLGLPDGSGLDLIEHLRQDPTLDGLPVVIHTGRELSPDEASRLHALAEGVIVKGVEAFDRLLDETALHLHRVEARLSDDQRARLEKQHRPEATLAGRTVLVVDDDVRNIFALQSLLEGHKMNVLYAESGRDGLEALQSADGAVDVVLMDIMMPGMDGYEATRAIRQMERFADLPVIAVTAKAMHGDREKCLEAGASDYLTKPVNVDQLVSLLRVWVGRKP